jgi:hypothetical protein
MITARRYLPNRQRTRESRSGRLVHFPARAVWISRDAAWIVLCGRYGWLHGDICSALKDARWLSENSGLPIKSAATANDRALTIPEMLAPHRPEATP